MAISASIVICTHNRCKSLRSTLASLKELEGSKDDCEIVVVDNSSSDGTRRVVGEFSNKIPFELRYIFEPKLGLSQASNTGVREARGRICLFTADDVIVDRKWLLAMLDAFRDFQADCVYGRVYPVWEGKRPSWLSERLYGKLALLNCGDKPFRLTVEGKVYGCGANWGVKKALFEELGFFRTDLGVKGKRRFCGEEQEFLYRLLKQGYRAFYQPASIVHHRIPRDGLKKLYFRRWHFDSGISYSKMEDGKDVARFPLGIPRYLAGEFMASFFNYIRFGLQGNGTEVFLRELDIIFILGFVWGRLKDRLISKGVSKWSISE